MWFKNIKIFRLHPHWSMTNAALNELLQQQIFADNAFTSGQVLNMGWVPIFPELGTLVHSIGNQHLIRLRIEKKLLPASVINQFTRAKAQEIEEEQGYKVGRKKLKEIKENVTAVLRTKAFSIYRDTTVWFDVDHHFLVLDAGTSSKSDEVIGLLAKLLDPLPIQSIISNTSPSVAMSAWVSQNQAPHGFSIDQDTELKSLSDTRATVRYANHSPDPHELQKHLESGKICTKLALTWHDRVSFVLNDTLDIKKISPLEIINQTRDYRGDDEIENLNADMALMFGEINGLLSDLIDALDGEKTA